jgi:hypothetical protein
MKSEALDKIVTNTVSKGIYDALLSVLKGLGSYDIEAKKTSLHIAHGRAFLGVHPRRDGLLINIVTQHMLASDRIKKSEQVSANRWHNEVMITDPTQFDDELVGWITEAYGLTG